GREMPITFTAWIVASLCVIGMPLTGGFWSKWYLANGALDAGQPLMMAVVLLGSLLAMGYLLPPAIRAFYGTPAGGSAEADPHASPASDAHVAPPESHGRSAALEAPWPSLVALTLTAVVS